MVFKYILVDIDANYKSVLWIKVSGMFILGAVYIPHENSKYHYSDLFGDLSYDGLFAIFHPKKQRVTFENFLSDISN